MLTPEEYIERSQAVADGLDNIKALIGDMPDGVTYSYVSIPTTRWTVTNWVNNGAYSPKVTVPFAGAGDWDILYVGGKLKIADDASLNTSNPVPDFYLLYLVNYNGWSKTFPKDDTFSTYSYTKSNGNFELSIDSVSYSKSHTFTVEDGYAIAVKF